MTHRLAAVAMVLFIAVLLYGLVGYLYDEVLSKWR